MWVEGGDIQDELLDQLGTVLTVPEDLALTPSAAELEALAAAVAVRWPDSAPAPARGAAPVRPIRPVASHSLRRLGSSAWRAGSVAAAVVLFSASAAAAAGGVPLPRPVRAVAYTVGLPVDSPALDDTNHHIKELQAAVKANDKPKAVATAERLTTDLTKVPAEEKKEAVQKVDAAMITAATLIQAPAPTTAPAAPASSSTTATGPASSTTATTTATEEKAPATTTTTAPGTTTTTEREPTTTTTAPADGAPADGGGASSGDPGTGDQGSGGDGGSTTPTTTPDATTTTTTAPAGGDPSGGDPTTTTTTSSSSTTTTTTMPPADPGTGATP